LRKKSESITWVLEKITDKEVFGFIQWKCTQKNGKNIFISIYFWILFCFEMKTDKEVLGFIQWKYTQKLQKHFYKYIFLDFILF
jgi:hypothetical protein